MLIGRKRMNRNMNTGTKKRFTLIELLIAVVVLAVLLTTAVAAYDGIMKKTRRAEAREALSEVAARQEQFFLDNKRYATTAAQLGVLTTTENAYYTLAIDAQPPLLPMGYTITATAINAQANDTLCLNLVIRSNGSRIPDACW